MPYVLNNGNAFMHEAPTTGGDMNSSERSRSNKRAAQNTLQVSSRDG